MIKTHLLIHGLTLNVFLGWKDEELEEPQTVLLDVEIFFDKRVKACDSDELADTFCYAHLIEHLKKEIETKRKFRLIEHLAKTIYQLLKALLNDQNQLIVKLTKYPKIAGLTKVCFSYGDS